MTQKQQKLLVTDSVFALRAFFSGEIPDRYPKEKHYGNSSNILSILRPVNGVRVERKKINNKY